MELYAYALGLLAAKRVWDETHVSISIDDEFVLDKKSHQTLDKLLSDYQCDVSTKEFHNIEWITAFDKQGCFYSGPLNHHLEPRRYAISGHKVIIINHVGNVTYAMKITAFRDEICIKKVELCQKKTVATTIN